MCPPRFTFRESGSASGAGENKSAALYGKVGYVRVCVCARYGTQGADLFLCALIFLAGGLDWIIPVASLCSEISFVAAAMWMSGLLRVCLMFGYRIFCRADKMAY